MTIAAAAKATREYRVEARPLHPTGYNVDGRFYATHEESQVACDRLNLLAVLDALREPSEGMVTAGYGYADPADIWLSC